MHLNAPIMIMVFKDRKVTLYLLERLMFPRQEIVLLFKMHELCSRKDVTNTINGVNKLMIQAFCEKRKKIPRNLMDSCFKTWATFSAVLLERLKAV